MLSPFLFPPHSTRAGSLTTSDGEAVVDEAMIFASASRCSEPFTVESCRYLCSARWPDRGGSFTSAARAG